MAATMEAWLSELEMEVLDPISTLITNNSYKKYNHDDGIIIETPLFDEELATTIAEDFLHSLTPPDESNAATSPQWNFDCDLVHQRFTPPSDNFEKHNNNNNYTLNNNDDDGALKNVKSIVKKKQQSLEDPTANNKEDDGDTNQEVVSGGRKRKRQPNQVQDHIIAERKRRELLGQLFISLSAIVPGLKKTDKTSVLGEAIKHMKQLQEKVKILEEVAAKRTMESMVVVRRSQLIIDDNDGGNDNVSSSTLDEHCVSGNSDGSTNNDGGHSDMHDTFPEIVVKIVGKTLLLRICCANQKGILGKLFAKADKYDIRITNFTVTTPFGTLAQDITIVAQIEEGFNEKVKDFVRILRSTLRMERSQ